MFLQITYTFILITVVSVLVVYSTRITEEYIYIRTKLEEGISQLSNLNKKLDSFKNIVSLFPSDTADDHDHDEDEKDDDDTYDKKINKDDDIICSFDNKECTSQSQIDDDLKEFPNDKEDELEFHAELDNDE